jgi:hypothetical protein
MHITKESLSVLYSEYNRLYFNNKLGKCSFSFFSKKVSYLGWYDGKVLKNGKVKDKIWIGKSVIWTEDLLKKILLHEMIHMYNNRIDKCKYNGLFGHGKYFKIQCKRIQNEFGIDVLDLPKIEFLDKKFSPSLLERILLFIFDR